MAKRRKGRRRKGRVPKHLRKYLFKRKRRTRARKAYKMARRKRTSRRRRSTGRRHTTRRRRRGASRGSGGYALKPSRDDLHLMGATAAVGWLEFKSKSEPDFFLNKVPRPVAQVGFTGNLALVAWVASHFVHNKWLRLFARGAAMVTTYQLGRMLSPFSEGQPFFVGAGEYSDDDINRALQARIGALQSDAMNPAGVMFDDSVASYGG